MNNDILVSFLLMDKYFIHSISKSSKQNKQSTKQKCLGLNNQQDRNIVFGKSFMIEWYCPIFHVARVPISSFSHLFMYFN